VIQKKRPVNGGQTMDPNASLAMLRGLIERYQRGDKMTRADVEALVDHAEALDCWLSKGGFLPEAWKR
jgi:hypothetical protein